MLQNAPFVSGEQLIFYDRKYGHFLGKKINELIELSGITPDIVASHGHTIFHSPEKKVSFQMGHGASIAAECNLPVMFDFRSLDVALGGHGAPLVPIGDKLLFPQFDACLNLGGFANVSLERNEKRIAWDICPVNFIANHLASLKGLQFDRDGAIGVEGKVQKELLKKLENLNFYKKKHPKSLAREWVESNMAFLLSDLEYSVEDSLRTFYEHVAHRIVSDIDIKSGKVLCTGGGAKNRFLMRLVREKAKWEVVIPENDLIDFKEALIFAFLCFLKQNGKPNCLASVTGATRDCLGGSLIN
jgi:anhydro-N-acetylmuramic acid kinase